MRRRRKTFDGSNVTFVCEKCGRELGVIEGDFGSAAFDMVASHADLFKLGHQCPRGRHLRRPALLR